MATNSKPDLRDYIRVDSLPEAWQPRLAEWLYRQTCPVIPSEVDAKGQRAPCAYRWDYEHWLASFQQARSTDRP